MVAITKKQREIEKKRIIEQLVYPWDQQPGEPEKAFHLFLCYLAIGKTRNYTEVFRTCGVSYPLICKYGESYSWKMRSDKHDIAKDKEMMVKLDEEVMLSKIRQQRIGKDMQELANRGLIMLNENVEELSPQDITKLIDIGVKIERLALGSPNEIVKSEVDAKVEVKVEEISPEIAAKIGKEIAMIESEKMGEK